MTPVMAAAPAGHAALAAPVALGGGGGGLAHLILRLFIWRMVWRLGLLIWHIPAVGPGVFLLIVAVLIGVAIIRSRRGRPGPGGAGRATAAMASGRNRARATGSRRRRLAAGRAGAR